MVGTDKDLLTKRGGNWDWKPHNSWQKSNAQKAVVKITTAKQRQKTTTQNKHTHTHKDTPPPQQQQQKQVDKIK